MLRRTKKLDEGKKYKGKGGNNLKRNNRKRKMQKDSTEEDEGDALLMRGCISAAYLP